MRRTTLLGALAATLGVAPPLQAVAQDTTLTAATGEALRAIVAGPTDAPAGLLLVHDYFGVTDFYRSSVARFAAQGYRVVAVDLYGGKESTTAREAWQLMSALGRRHPAEVAALLDAGLEALRASNRRIAAVGFSAGGDWAFRLLLAHPDRIVAAAILYGGGMEAHPDSLLARIRSPILLATGSADSWALATALALLPRLDSLARGAELYVYPKAQHAFAQPLYGGGVGYDPVATTATWRVVDDYLRRQLLMP